MNKGIKLISTIWLRLKHGKSLVLNGFQEISFKTSVGIIDNGKICLGNNTITMNNVGIHAAGGVITIGNNCFFNNNCMIVARKNISIGNDCSFGPNVCIYDHDHIYDEKGFRKTEYNCSQVCIEDDCWIGANAIILRGTHIGGHSVIGAGAIVAGNIPAHSLVKPKRTLDVTKIERKAHEK